MTVIYQQSPEAASKGSLLDLVRRLLHNLPNHCRWLDWGLLLALALGLFAASPFLVRAGLPRKTDAELHVYRAAELQYILRQGVLYPRWAPNLYLGYGYPIFNYYAPLTYYLSNLFALAPGVNIVGGVKAVFVLGLMLASLGSYLLSRDLFGPASGVIAAASFTFAPYVVFIDPHARGDLAEHFAICLLPFVFFYFHRLMRSPSTGRWPFLGSVLALAAVVFSHNLLGLVTGGLLAGYWLWQIIVGPGDLRLSRVRWGALAFLLSAALIAFFWLPFLLERSAIKLDVIGPGHFDFRRHFLSLREILAPSQLVDWGATGPRFRHNLGMAQWLLALPGLGVLLGLGTSHGTLDNDQSASKDSRWACVYFALAGLGLIFLMLPLSTVVWEHVPAMPYMQFPWRLLGPANLMLAVCSAGSVALLPSDHRWRGPILAAGLAVILMLALPMLYPPPWETEFGGTAPVDIIRWEWESSSFGTTSTGDFLPEEAAQTSMRPVESLVRSHETPGPVDKVNRATLPDGATVEVVEHGPLHDRLTVATPEAFLLRLYTFYFPGWRAYVDGEEVKIELGRPEGFITLWVPEGEHEVLVRFEDTPARIAGWVISGVGLMGLIGVLMLMRSGPQDAVRFAGLRCRWFYWLVGPLVAVVGFKFVLADSLGWFHHHSPPGQAVVAQKNLKASFEGKIELLGYDLPQRPVRPGQTISIMLYWRAQAPLEANYQSFVHLVNPLHTIWGQKDHLNPGGLPTQRWPTDKYVWDEYKLQVLPGTPPGEYLVNVGLYSMWDGYRLQRYDQHGQVAGDSLVVGSIIVKRPRRQPKPSTLDMAQQTMLEFPAGGVTLLGYTQSREQVGMSESWTLTLFWRADQESPLAERREIVLLDSEGEEVMQHPASGTPVDGRYPFHRWQSGEVVRDQVVFAPTDLPPGVYQVGVKVGAGDDLLMPGEGESEIVLLGAMEYLPE
jgi:hypothetical protein